MGEPVGGAHHEIVEGELGIEIHGGGDGLPLVEIVFLGFVVENQELGVGVEDLLQGVLNIVGAAAADDVPAEVRGGVEDQIVIIQLPHLRVVKPGGYGHGAQPLLNVTQDLCPDIGG